VAHIGSKKAQKEKGRQSKAETKRCPRAAAGVGGRERGWPGSRQGLARVDAAVSLRQRESIVPRARFCERTPRETLEFEAEPQLNGGRAGAGWEWR